MENEEFRRRLAEEVGKAGGVPAVGARLVARYGLKTERARNQVNRALKVPVGLEIMRNVVSVLDLTASQKRELLELPADDPVAPQLASIRAFQMTAAIRSFDSNVWASEWNADSIFCEPYAVRLVFSNLSPNLVAVTGLRLDVSCKPLVADDLPSSYFKAWVPSDTLPKTPLVYVVNSVVYLLPDGYAVLKDASKRFDVGGLPRDGLPGEEDLDFGSGDILEASAGDSVVIKVPAGDMAFLNLEVYPKEPQSRPMLYRFEIVASAIDIDMNENILRSKAISLATRFRAELPGGEQAAPFNRPPVPVVQFRPSRKR